MGIFGHVNSLVRYKGRALTETPPAFRAFVWLLLRVDSLMRSEGRAPIEALPTLWALVGFLPSVDPLVFSQIGFVAKALATF